MSAFVVDLAHIDTLVNAGLKYADMSSDQRAADAIGGMLGRSPRTTAGMLLAAAKACPLNAPRRPRPR